MEIQTKKIEFELRMNDLEFIMLIELTHSI